MVLIQRNEPEDLDEAEQQLIDLLDHDPLDGEFKGGDIKRLANRVSTFRRRARRRETERINEERRKEKEKAQEDPDLRRAAGGTVGAAEVVRLQALADPHAGRLDGRTYYFHTPDRSGQERRVDGAQGVRERVASWIDSPEENQLPKFHRHADCDRMERSPGEYERVRWAAITGDGWEAAAPCLCSLPEYETYSEALDAAPELSDLDGSEQSRAQRLSGWPDVAA